MASDLVSVGTLPNDGTGAPLRAVVTAYNGNFARLDDERAAMLSTVVVAMFVGADGHLVVFYADGTQADLGDVTGPVGVASAAVNGQGRLILTRSDGTTIDAGSVVGAPGAAGRTILNGAGAPADATGTNGDFYLDTANSRLYGPKAAGAWGLSFVSLVGPAGPSGGQSVTALSYWLAGG